MKFNKLVLASVLSVASATPIPELDSRTTFPTFCPIPQVNQIQATQLVTRYAAVIGHLSSDLGSAAQTAALIVDSAYTEQSDSANIQLGIPLGALTTPSKQAFITNSQADPPVLFKTLNVFVTGCNSVLWQWQTTKFGSNQYPVKGFHLFNLDQSGLIQSTFFEFNSIAGALDIGFVVKNAQGQKLTPSNV